MSIRDGAGQLGTRAGTDWFAADTLVARQSCITDSAVCTRRSLGRTIRNAAKELAKSRFCSGRSPVSSVELKEILRGTVPSFAKRGFASRGLMAVPLLS